MRTSTNKVVSELSVRQQQKAILWSRVPGLNLGGTKRRRDRTGKIPFESSGINWANLEREVRQEALGNSPCSLLLPIRYYVVAKENDISARTVESFSQAFGPVFSGTVPRLSGSTKYIRNLTNGDARHDRFLTMRIYGCWVLM
ncbi:hypothetical protein VTN00DRAFT_8682 [Thermoascus crustaceus]|uniref:uncharacterized protein n=1 Tax=Thermoascus crustaceus TaxID=5088 RepID=UPI0037425723